MSFDLEHQFSQTSNISLLAPAGYGKTEELVKAIGNCSGRQLLLTHTHAGVKSIRNRLKKHTPSCEVHLDTIAGWCLSFTSSYRSLSHLSVKNPKGDEWPLVYTAMLSFIKSTFGKQLLSKCFSGAFIDEYQDCTLPQHAIILELSKLIPCRLAGDPLQGIFNFKEPTVDWIKHVIPNFPPIAELRIPWRWKDNSDLGNWLKETRFKIERGKSIDLSSSPIVWLKHSEENCVNACLEASKDYAGSVVAIETWPKDCHSMARKLSGVFDSMEPIDCPDLAAVCLQLDSATDGLDWIEVGKEILTLSCVMMPAPLIVAQEIADYLNIPELSTTAKDVSSNPSAETLIRFIRQALASYDLKICRKELLTEFLNTLSEKITNDIQRSFSEHAWEVRNKTSANGRKASNLSISRTLLVKGLEFGKTVVLNADKLTAKNFYVAITRPTEKLTILSTQSIKTFNQ